MKIKKKGVFWSGVSILAFLIISYFISFPSEQGANYVVNDTLLGILIFHNPFILALYVLTGLALTISGLKIKN